MGTAGASCAACARTRGPQVGRFHVKLAHQTLRLQHCARAVRGPPGLPDGDKKRLRQPAPHAHPCRAGRLRAAALANRMGGCDGCLSSTAGAGRLLAAQSTGVPAQPACSARCPVRSGTAARRPPNGAGKAVDDVGGQQRLDDAGGWPHLPSRCSRARGGSRALPRAHGDRQPRRPRHRAPQVGGPGIHAAGLRGILLQSAVKTRDPQFHVKHAPRMAGAGAPTRAALWNCRPLETWP